MSAVDDYLDSVSEPQRAELQRIRRIVQQTVPDAVEVISYGMPVFKYKSKYLIGFATFKDHMSLFPGALPAEFVDEQLQEFKTSRGTVQFTLDHPVPEQLVIDLINFRLERITNP